MLDIFESDAFGVTTLTDAINKLEFVPGRIAEMGLFQADGVTTTSIAIEEKSGQLIIVPPTPRGAPGTTMDKSKRKMRRLEIPHFELNGAVMAEEVQGVRAFGQESAVEMAMDKVATVSSEFSQSMDATEEHARLGAIKGIVTYADGSTLNLFDVFEVAPPATEYMNLAAADNGELREKCAQIIRGVMNYMGGEPVSGFHCLCGDNFFDAILKNPEVRATYDGWSEAKILREGYISPNGKIYSAFEFGGIVWENYRGGVGGTPFIAANEGHMFPTSPTLFRTRWAPADYWETVNTKGVRLYGQTTMMKNNKGVDVDVQMNAIHYCRRPSVLRTLNMAASA